MRRLFFFSAKCPQPGTLKSGTLCHSSCTGRQADYGIKYTPSLLEIAFLTGIKKFD
jgi:hypothetical protein